MRYILIFLLCLAGVAQAQRLNTDLQTVEIVTKAEDLNVPWAVAIISDTEFLVTERDGQLLYFKDGQRQSVKGVPKVWANGQGGLLDVVLARDFARSRDIFLTYSEPQRGRAGTALGVAKLSADGSQLQGFTRLFTQSQKGRGGRHFGSRVVEAGNGDLFLTIGDRGQPETAQDPDLTNGKVIRVTRNGKWQVHSTGHRNPQGADLDWNGEIWTVEHGPKGGDEVNKPKFGLNYGWPVISYGVNYNGTRVGIGTEAPGLEQPMHYWDPSIAPSGMMIYSGKLFKDWEHDIFIGSLKFDMISRLTMELDEVTERERLFEGRFGRIRDIREAPDGTIWFLSVGDDALYQMKPG